MPEGDSHGRNLIGTSQIEFVVKLLILRVFDLLANDDRESCTKDSENWEVCQSWGRTARMISKHIGKPKETGSAPSNSCPLMTLGPDFSARTSLATCLPMSI
jgi:hypothetical protein